MYSRPMVRGVVLALLIIAAASSPQAQTAKTPQTQTQHAAAMIAEGNADDALQLLDTILAHGRTLGCTEAWLGTEETNEPARSLYRGAGGISEPFTLYSFRLESGK